MTKRRTRKQISYNMSRIRAKGSEIEKIFAKALRKNKIRFVPNCDKIIGKPDFVLKGRNIAVFCDSAFWHGYKKMKSKLHDFKVNKKFWVAKIQRNIERDAEVDKALKKMGWQIIRFWDFEIEKDVDRCLVKLKKAVAPKA